MLGSPPLLLLPVAGPEVGAVVTGVPLLPLPSAPPVLVLVLVALPLPPLSSPVGGDPLGLVVEGWLVVLP